MLISSKLHIPRLHPFIVKRSSLMHNLNKGLHFKLTVVSAQAGYGKTTALSEWTQQCKAQIVWISLSKHDNDFIQFWRYVLSGIEEHKPDFTLKILPKLTSHVSTSYESFMIALIQGLQSLNDEWVLVFDDFHSVEQALIHSSLAFLLEYLPPNVHLYFSSRSELPFPTARLEAKGECHKIDVQDLRFRLENGIDFFQLHQDLQLTREQVSLLVDQTEGWVRGLQLAVHSLAKTKDQAQFIRKFSGKQRDTAHYLMEEVFQHQSEEIRNFLLKTSILSEMNYALCEAVTEQKGCQEKLEKLEQLNLMVVPLDDQRVWYRYHQMFADFLQHELKQKHPKQWSSSHANAAHWLEANGYREEAVDHLLAGAHYAEAVALIEKLLPTTHHSKWHVLHGWLTILPETAIIGRPMIDIYFIGALIGVGEWEIASKRVKDAEKRLLAIKDYLSNAEWKQAGGTLYFFSAVISSGQKDMIQANEYFERFDILMPEGNPFQMIGGNSFGGTDHDDILAWINNLSGADVYLNQRIKAWGGKRDYPAVGYFLISYSELLYEWNRIEEAKIIAEQVMKRKDMQPFARILVRAGAVAAMVQWAQGDSKRAIAVLEQVKLQINSPDQASFLMRVEAQEVRLALLQGSVALSTQWSENFGLYARDAISLYPILDYLILAKALGNAGLTSEALELLDRIYLYASKEDRLRDKIKVCIVQSILLYKEGNTQVALIKLEEALQLAEPEGYIRSFVDEGSIMIQMLSAYSDLPKRYLRKPAVVSLSYVRQLLEALKGNEQEVQPLKVLLTEQEMRVLKLIEKGLSNKQIAEHVYVTAETVKTHIKNIYRKLKANTRVHAIQCSRELGIL